MVEVIKNACSPMLLEFIKFHAQQSDNWNFRYPMGSSTPFEDKHAKLEVISGNKKMPDEKLSGLSAALLINIYVIVRRIQDRSIYTRYIILWNIHKR